jgi:hypothetical protein
MAQTNALTGCWDMFKRGAQRHLKPGIFIELAPTGEGKASAWLQRRASKQSAIA